MIIWHIYDSITTPYPMYRDEKIIEDERNGA
jgi:hypothetical protein